ncbi:MAG: zinc-ribbon domain-containing protein [Terrisporobacter sp.]|uniref:double zinc ribbon domain-containing protein n=1 Tax=Terrisporobacter sp. TaxID=1965305 RepID=UPI002FC65905
MCNGEAVVKEIGLIKVCKECGERNYDGVNFCQDCGAMLVEFKHIFCQICGTKNEVENKICNECKIIL